jgi:YfiH family protein
MAESVRFFRFPHLMAVPGLVHGVSQRHGGASPAPYASLNLSLAVGDEPDRVVENRRRLATALGIPVEGLVFAQQVHGRGVSRVTAADRGRGLTDRGDALPATDALYTDTPGVYLCLLFADCVPVLVVDPRRRLVGLAHAGWQGTAQGVARALVETLRAAAGVDPADLLVGIGPSIGPCCYTVRAEVLRALQAEEPALEAVVRPAGPDQWRLDLWAANRRQVERAGVPPERIVLAGLCTRCHQTDYYSHRAEGQTGRFAAVIGFRP